MIFGYGNPGRGDDAIGPVLVERIEAAAPAHPQWGELAFATDFQLQPEHALEIEGHARVLFIDADVSCAAPFAFRRIAAAADAGYTTHAMSPAALLAVFRLITCREPPAAFVLAVRGGSFELGEPLGDAARANCERAFDFVGQLLSGGWKRFD